MKKDQGFSLVEILVVICLMGVLAVIMMNMTEQQTRNQATADVKFENLEFRREVANLLAKKTACEMTFNGLKIGDPITGLKNASGTPVFEKGKVYGHNSLKIKDMSSALIRDNGDGSFNIDLIIDFEKMKTLALGSTTQIRFPLVVGALNGTSPISSCMTNDSLWALDGNDIYNTNSENVGIGTMTPATKLDVAGGIRPGSEVEITACGMGKANGEGVQRYNYSHHYYEYCNGTSWVKMGGSGSFGGAYSLNTFAGWSCKHVNPMTGSCSCPPGYMSFTSGQYWNYSKWDTTAIICYMP